MHITESKHLMEGAVTSFRGEATNPERWSDLPKVAQLVNDRSGTQTRASESRTAVSTPRLDDLVAQWLHGSGVPDQLLCGLLFPPPTHAHI